MLLVNRFGHVEENAVEVFLHYGFHLSSFLCKIASLFRENNNVIILPFTFHVVMSICGSSAFKDSFYPKHNKLPRLLSAHPPFEKAVNSL